MAAWGKAALAFMLCAAIALATWAYMYRGETDILARYASQHPYLIQTTCDTSELGGQRVAKACYEVKPQHVYDVIEFLQDEYNLPDVITHGEGWHTHGYGGFDISDHQKSDFDHLDNPGFVSGVISFYANAHPEFWPDTMPPLDSNVVIIPLGALPAYVTVELLYV